MGNIDIPAIIEFKDEYKFLSNFYTCAIEFEGVIYPTVENAYQAAKTENINHRRPFAACTPAQAKKLGKYLTLRDNWEYEKATYMLNLVSQKFKDPVLAQRLLDTGEDILIEGNYWHDNYWGMCTCEKCKETLYINTLGKILMAVRRELQGANSAGTGQTVAKNS